MVGWSRARMRPTSPAREHQQTRTAGHREPPKLDPVATTTDGIYIAGTCAAPRASRQRRPGTGGAARPREDLQGQDHGRRGVRGGQRRAVLGVPDVQRGLPVQRHRVRPVKKRSHVISAVCKACGACAVTCPSAAIKPRHFTMTRSTPRSKGCWHELRTQNRAFLCNWCSYTGADLAGTSRIQYQPTSASSA